jgi:hypothetical protein
MAMRDWVTKDFGWKLASLIVAAVIWHIVPGIPEEPAAVSNSLDITGATTFSNFYDLPVLVVSAAEDVRAFKVNPDTVTITVSGTKENLSKLKTADIHPVVNLTGIESAQSLDKRVDISMPPGITLVAVEPPEVNVVVPPK